MHPSIHPPGYIQESSMHLSIYLFITAGRLIIHLSPSFVPTHTQRRADAPRSYRLHALFKKKSAPTPPPPLTGLGINPGTWLCPGYGSPLEYGVPGIEVLVSPCPCERE